ncbi:protein containing Glycosyl transferase, family 2 domain protein, partial [human gut metagenome]
MEQAPLISIIMPVYNAGVLLHTAVESVLRQSFADFELLLVDDGSTDGSAALAHELDQKKMAASGCWNSPMRASALRATLACSIAAASGSLFVMMMIPCCLMHWKPCWSLPNRTGADVVRGGYRLLRANAA